MNAKSFIVYIDFDGYQYRVPGPYEYFDDKAEAEARAMEIHGEHATTEIHPVGGEAK